MLGTSALSQAPSYPISPPRAIRGNAGNVCTEPASRLPYFLTKHQWALASRIPLLYLMLAHISFASSVTSVF